MRISPLFLAVAVVLASGSPAAASQLGPATAPTPAPQAAPTRSGRGASPRLTFTRDIAPLLYQHCVICHRPGEIGPFNLIGYRDVRQHLTQIADVTRRRVMPPWQPDIGIGDFVDARVLSAAEIDTLGQWIADGAPEGDVRDLPAVPTWTDGWQLGTPDLIVTMPEEPEEYVVRGDGPDIFRTFVLPIPTTAAHNVRAVEFRPGNPRAVHHANFGIDRSRASRRLDAQDPEPGHSGSMAPEAAYPPGYMLGWTPGQRPRPSPDGMAWRLEQDSDLVVQLHLQPTGKSEPVKISVAFYFTDAVAGRAPVGLRLGSETIDIPAADPDYVISDSYTLPVDADLLAVQPHAHNLARRMEASATLPDRTVVPLIAISDWDFRWQDVYRYARPIPLPRGTTIAMRYSYDNSAGNARNPHQPPQRILWGQRTEDEMGDLWLQLVPRVDAEFARLAMDVAAKARREDLHAYTRLMNADPASAPRHDAVALLYLEDGDAAQAAKHFRESVRLNPNNAVVHYNLGLALSAQRKLDEATTAFTQAVQLDPDYAEAHNNLGAMLQVAGRFDEAAAHYRRALAIRPENAEAHDNLGRILAASGHSSEALIHFRQALTLRPEWAAPLRGLAWVHATSRDPAVYDGVQAVGFAERAVALSRPGDPTVLDALAAAYAAAGQFERATITAQAAVQGAAMAGLTAFADEIRQRLDLYRRGTPFRDGS
jgi:Flp pilus assembly protein TadD